MAVSPRLGCLQSTAILKTTPCNNHQKAKSDVSGLEVYIAKVPLYFLGPCWHVDGPGPHQKKPNYIEIYYPSR